MVRSNHKLTEKLNIAFAISVVAKAEKTDLRNKVKVKYIYISIFGSFTCCQGVARMLNNPGVTKTSSDGIYH